MLYNAYPPIPQTPAGGLAMATATRTTVLKTAIATYPHTKGLKDGTVTAPGIEFEHVEISPDHRGLPSHVSQTGIRRLPRWRSPPT